uniref:Uncharacterized protein n=1 Tax=Mustela putorius furo TaxID=9669 RepID=M3Y8R7_MUSPF
MGSSHWLKFHVSTKDPEINPVNKHHFIYFRERARAGGAEREEERIPRELHAEQEPKLRLNPMTTRPLPELKPRARPLTNWATRAPHFTTTFKNLVKTNKQINKQK